MEGFSLGAVKAMSFSQVKLNNIKDFMEIKSFH